MEDGPDNVAIAGDKASRLAQSSSAPLTVALVGNPNAGKTTLFNRLTGSRAHTANFPGTTVEHRRGRLRDDNREPSALTVIDLPGLYSLEATTPDEQVAVRALTGQQDRVARPDAVVIVIDATNLERNLPLAAETLALGQPTLVALNMSDLAERLGLRLDLEKLSARLGCPVVRLSARSGDGIEQLTSAIGSLVGKKPLPSLVTLTEDVAACGSCNGCGYASRFAWAESVRAESVSGDLDAAGQWTDALDTVLTHRIGGLVVFAAIMFGLFMTIFSLATVPMDQIDGLFAWGGETVGQWLPEGDIKSLIVDGVISGVGGVLVFLPQICLLFFLLALLEDSGYLARAALVMDRLMQRVGLPGQAFVPMLSAHACAIPAILAARVVRDPRDRLATILVAPLLSCSARVPVYVMVVAMLFPESPIRAAAVFAGAYALGIVAALVMAWILKKTILPGESRPLVLELPNYRRPSIRGALLQTVDRAWSFVETAGTTILVISLVLWAMATYPKTAVEDLPDTVRSELSSLVEAGDAAAADALLARESVERSLAGRIGKAVQPIFEPLGFDWKITVGVVTSFAAREVVVSTLSILYGLGEEAQETSLLTALRSATFEDGTPVFSTPTCLSLLVFFVLAMQCLPTQAVTRRETGGWKWPLFQLGYMSLLAYGAALVTHLIARQFA